MVKKRYNICPITGEEIHDRTYNKKARYSKQGYKIARKQYKDSHNKVYYVLKKIVGVGIKGEEYAIGNITNDRIRETQIKD